MGYVSFPRSRSPALPHSLARPALWAPGGGWADFPAATSYPSMKAVKLAVAKEDCW